MRRLLCPGVGALLLAVAVLPRPGSAADAIHPLDPGAAPGVLAVDDPFADHVPLLDRGDPAPSFATAPAGDGVPRIEPAMDDGGHAGTVRGAGPTTAAPTE